MAPGTFSEERLGILEEFKNEATQTVHPLLLH
jgi:hypothetical protein